MPGLLNPTIRYFPPGVRRIYWAPVLANYLAPTRAELDAGTDLTGEISATAGWTVTRAIVESTDMTSRFTSQYPAGSSMDASSITCYMSRSSNDVRSLLMPLLRGYILSLWEGDTPGLLMDVFPVRVLALVEDTGTDDPGEVTISFAGGLPALNVTIPSPSTLKQLTDEAGLGLTDETGASITDET